MNKELEDYLTALRMVAQCCERPFGKDARMAKRIALAALAKWGRKPAP